MPNDIETKTQDTQNNKKSKAFHYIAGSVFYRKLFYAQYWKEEEETMEQLPQRVVNCGARQCAFSWRI